MTTYRITAPDGKTYDVTGDGTKEEALAQVQAKVGAAPKPKPAKAVDLAKEETESNSFLDNALLGVGKNVSDTITGGKQLWASLKGDEEEKARLNQEVADNKKANEAISGSGGGFVGDVGTSIATSFLPGLGLAKGAQAIKFLPKVVKAAAPVAALGAGQGVLTPDEDYNALGQAGTGAALNLAGDVVGRGVARAFKPIQSKVSNAVAEKLDTIKTMLPDAKLLAENLSDKPIIRAMTTALSQLPGGGKVVAGREGNLAELTKRVTKEAGRETPELTEATTRRIFDRLDQQGNAMRAGGDIDLPNIEKALQDAQTAPAQLEARILGTNRPAAQLRSAEAALIPTPPPTHSTILGPNGQPIPLPAQPPAKVGMSAPEAMNLREELGDQVFGTDSGISSKGAKLLKDQIEAGLTTKHPGFPKWLEEYGTWRDIAKTKAAKGLTPGGHIKPEVYQSILSQGEKELPTGINKLVAAAADRMPLHSATDNRAMMVNLLKGTPLLAGAGLAGSLLIDGKGLGDSAAAGTGTALGSYALARALLGTAGGGRYLTGNNKSAVGKALQSPEMKEALRHLSAQLMRAPQGD